MARQSSDKTKYIKYVFPKDFEQLDSMLSVNEIEETLKLNTTDWFHVHPEYDLSYKLLSMIYSNVKKHRFNSFRELYREIKNTEQDDLFFHSRGRFEWNDYMFQVLGIFDLLGIKRDFHIGASAEKSNDKQSILEVIQNPILFLLLIDCKIYDEAFFADDIIALVNHAITAYKQGKESNMFNGEQLERCYEFILRGSKNPAFRAYLGDNRVAEIEEKVRTILDDYLDNNNLVDYFNSNDLTDYPNNYKEEKGNIISFPKYIRAILLGMHEEYKCLKSFSPLVEKKSLWSKNKEINTENIKSKTLNSFIRL